MKIGGKGTVTRPLPISSLGNPSQFVKNSTIKLLEIRKYICGTSVYGGRHDYKSDNNNDNILLQTDHLYFISSS
jgi:hypothetical protein